MDLWTDAGRILDLLHEGAYCIDRDRRITHWNAAAVTLTGYRPDQVLGLRCRDDLLMHVSEDRGSLCDGQCPMAETLRDGQTREGDVFLKCADGSRCFVHVRIGPLFSDTHEIIGAVQVFQPNDAGVTLRSRLQELHQAATTDPVTGVAGRRLIEETVRIRLEEMRRSGWRVGALMVDIDEFKLINDRYGHVTGDEVLRAVALTLAHNVRPLDVVGRWGGDEFVVVAANVDARGLRGLADRLRTLVEGSGLQVDRASVSVTVSVGATLARPEDTPSALIDRADAFMYESKRDGRNRTTVEDAA
jgi:diguanylate cyclase (GGDEF)-like protein/PAS domain S-box-containing protein